MRDWVRAATFLATDDTCRGAYNLTGPGATTLTRMPRGISSAAAGLYANGDLDYSGKTNISDFFLLLLFLFVM